MCKIFKDYTCEITGMIFAFVIVLGCVYAYEGFTYTYECICDNINVFEVNNA